MSASNRYCSLSCMDRISTRRSGPPAVQLGRGMQAGHARHRHVEDRQVHVVVDRPARRPRRRRPPRPPPQVGLGLEHEPQAAAHHGVVVGEQDARLQRGHSPVSGERHARAVPRCRPSRRRPRSAARPRAPPARACRACRRPRRRLRVDAAAVVGHAQCEPRGRCSSAQLRLVGSRMARHVGQRLLGDPVDHELRLLAERRQLAVDLAVARQSRRSGRSAR